LKEATDWLEKYRKFWEEQYGRLDELLEELKIMETDKTDKRKRKKK